MNWGGMGWRVTVAVAVPPGPIAAIVAVADEGMTAGAVKSPAAVMVPAEAVKLVAPEEVNCWDWPRITETVVGAMVWGGTCTLFLNGTVSVLLQRAPGLTA
jgi:hypothetical protein